MVTRRDPRQGGYTFVEMLVAMAIAVIVGLGVYGIFSYQRRAAESQRVMNELQSGSRFAMDQIKRELTLAGYRAQDTVRPVKLADPNGIVFEYWDERARTEAPFDDSHYDRHSLVSYRLDGGTLLRTVRRWHTGTNSYQPGTADMSEAAVRADFASVGPAYRQILATNVDGFALQYFKQNNEPWNRDPDANPATAPPFDEIRSVVVSLQSRSAEPNPIFRNPGLGATGAERFPTVRLQSEIRLRNVDIAANPRDTTPPAVPGSPLPGIPTDQRAFRVWDPGLCDRLELSWGANIESDLAGYILYFGLASGSYSGRARVVASPGAPGDRVRYTLTGLQATKACDPVAAMYYLRIEAYDKSGNPSARSAEVAGNPPTSITTEAGTSATASDTTINPSPPPAPSGFTAATPADNQISLTWTKPSIPGLVGYRLYRSTAGAGFGPVGSVAGTGNCIADERTLGPDMLNLLDTGVFLDPPTLQGCTTYHYRLAAIHCDGCLPEAGMNFASASATTVDATPPPCPTISAHDGWRRIVLRLENPLRSVTRDFAYSRIWQSTSGDPAYDDHGTPDNPADDSVDGTPIPDTQVPGSPGTFTADGTVTINFDSTATASPDVPELQDDTSYYFLTVGYDACGNVCSPLGTAGSRTRGDQCADCLPGEVCYNHTQAATNLAATAGCGESISLSWVAPDATVYPDFYGFHIYRCPRQYSTECGDTADFGDAVWRELTDGYVWSPTFTDTKAQGLEEGRYYSYRIRATDCYYEAHHQTWTGDPATTSGDPDNDPKDNFSDAYIDNLYIGGVEREERFPGPNARLAAQVTAAESEIPVVSEIYQAANFPANAVTGERTIIVGEEILVCAGARSPTGTDSGAFTGCTRGTGGTSPAGHARDAIIVPQPSTRPIQALCGDLGEEPPSFLHNTMEFWLRNTAAGSLTMNTLSASWQNTNAFLELIDLGDGATTPATSVWIDAGNPLTNGATGVSLTLSSAELYPRDERIPLGLTFKNADRTVSVLTNMREELLDLSLGYRNDATGDAVCGEVTTVNVPLGPFISGTTQNWPQEGTVAAPVPGDGGLNLMNGVLVPGDLVVDVHTKASDSDYAGIREVRLYYHVDTSKLLDAAPPLAVGAHYDQDPELDNLAPYSRIAMVPVVGNQWRTPAGLGIPASNDANVWYFIVAVDNNGNFDREPEPGSGAFQYYQQPHDVCENVPGAPTLSGNSAADTVTLLWTAPAVNTDGSACTDLGGYKVYRLAAGSGPVLLAELPAGTLTHTDTPPAMDTETYTYYVTAQDTCEQPGPNEGPASNWFTECQGASGCTVRLVSNQQDPDFFQAGDGFTIELFTCEKINGVSGENLYVQACSGVDAGTVVLAESGDTGTFRLGAGQITTWLSEPAGAGSLDLRVSASDTITVDAWSETAPTGGCGSLTQCSATLQVRTDPCQGIALPTTPTLTAHVTGACKKSDSTINLSWTGGDPGSLLFYRVYRCSNADGSADCRPLEDGSKIFPVGAEPDLSQTAKALENAALKRPDENHIRYQVEAVSHNGCSDRSLWRTAISSAVADDCP